jgi:hypothetical protein
MEAMSASIRFVSRTTMVLGAGLAAFVSVSAFAGPPEVNVSLDWNYGTDTTTYTIHDADSWWIDGNTIHMQGADRDGSNPDGSDDTWRLDWEMQTLAPGIRGGSEFVTANIAVFNNTLSTQTYWVLNTKSGISVGPGVDTEGSVAASVFDLSGDGSGATMQNISSGGFAGDPIYRAYIDGTPQTALWTNGYQLNAAANSNANDSDQYTGVPGTEAVDTSISVWLKFEVTPLDSVNLLGYFQVNPVPAPAALSALGLFGLVAGRRRRRS